jgi:Flp pilus assembly protein TadD
MIRRWLCGCVLSSALSLGVAGCTSSLEQLTGGLMNGLTPGPKDGGDAPAHGGDELSSNEQLRLHLEGAREMDKAGKDDAALAEYERVLQLDRSNFTAMRRLCVLYDRRGSREDFKKAEEMYQKVTKLHPKDADIWNDWGYSLYLRTEKEHNQENWKEAETKLRHALQLEPQLDRAHTNLGLVLGGLNRFDEAFREFRAAHLSESEARCDMAYIYLTKGRFEDAKQECRIARDLDPGNNKALEMLAKLDQPPRSRERTAARPGAGSRGPRPAIDTADRDEKEHELARQTVAAMYGSAAAPGESNAGPWQPPTGPIAMPSGHVWMPVKTGAMPVMPAPTPVPVPAAPTPAPVPVPATSSGTEGTITY